MKSVSLNASARLLGRRAGAKKLRANGRIPAVIYGRQAKPQQLEISAKELEDLVKRGSSGILLVDLAVKDDARPKRLAMVQEVQHHPLSGKVLHLDFHEIAEDEKVTVMVPVETVGEASGVKNEGGVLEHVLFKVRVRGTAKELPEVLHVDVTAMKIGDSIHLGELKVPAGVELIGDKNIPVITVARPRTEEEEAAEAAAAAAPGEVEMIKEKKEDGTEGAAPAAAGKPGEKPAAGAEKGKAAPAAGEKKAAPGAGEKKPAAPGEKKK